MSACRDCLATVKWVRLDTGKSMPVEPIASHHRGSVAASLIGGRLEGHVISKTKPAGPSQLHYVPHRAQCKPDKPKVTAQQRAASLFDQ